MSDIKCPFCQQELEEETFSRGRVFVSCNNPNCIISDWGGCSKQIITELIRTRKALNLALAELHEIDGVCDDNKYTDNLYVGLDGQDTRNIARNVKKTITQITALTKGGDNE